MIPTAGPAPLGILGVRSIAAGLERGDCLSVSWLTGGARHISRRRGTFRGIGMSNFLLETTSGFLYSIHMDEIMEIRKISFEEMSMTTRRKKKGLPGEGRVDDSHDSGNTNSGNITRSHCRGMGKNALGVPSCSPNRNINASNKNGHIKEVRE